MKSGPKLLRICDCKRDIFQMYILWPLYILWLLFAFSKIDIDKRVIIFIFLAAISRNDEESALVCYCVQVWTYGQTF